MDSNPYYHRAKYYNNNIIIKVSEEAPDFPFHGVQHNGKLRSMPAGLRTGLGTSAVCHRKFM